MSIAINAPAYVKHAKLIAWVQEIADLVKPAQVVWADGSEDEYDRLSEQMVQAGFITPSQIQPAMNEMMAREFKPPATNFSTIAPHFMTYVKQTLGDRGLDSNLILQVHDELVFEVPEAEVDWLRAEIPRIMAGVASLRVPLVAEMGVGPNWEQAH